MRKQVVLLLLVAIILTGCSKKSDTEVDQEPQTAVYDDEAIENSKQNLGEISLDKKTDTGKSVGDLFVDFDNLTLHEGQNVEIEVTPEDNIFVDVDWSTGSLSNESLEVMRNVLCELVQRDKREKGLNMEIRTDVTMPEDLVAVFDSPVCYEVNPENGALTLYVKVYEKIAKEETADCVVIRGVIMHTVDGVKLLEYEERGA